jgi:4a-hydroxytetrahydrobiopterin dehydratase
MSRLTDQEIASRLLNLDGWELKENAIEKSFKLKNFKEAFSVMTRIAFECEAQNHHPEWSNVYSALHIRLNTHDAGGITEKDFKLAEVIEEIVGSL